LDYQIVATLGPAGDSPATWQAMVESGVTGFRLNTSHLSLPQLEQWLERLAAFLPTIPAALPVVLDLQGSKWRLGNFPARTLVEGERVTLRCESATEQANVLPVPHPDFFRAAAVSSDAVLLNDGRVRLRVESVADDSMTARVVTGTSLSARKGITYSRSAFRQESLSEQDQAILARTGGLAFVRYALSYVKDAGEMKKYRRTFGPNARLIAKLERQPAADEAQAIAKLADEVWWCRGDLGAEVGIRAMAQLTATFSRQVASLPVPALLAGQVLEHLTHHPIPTRSEVCHLYDSLQAGYAGLVLSDETAIGDDPVAACRAAALFRGC
jgi:pyruvate kinase